MAIFAMLVQRHRPKGVKVFALLSVITLGQIGPGKGKAPFVNKKKQTNFIDSGLWALSATQNQAQLSQEFLRRF
ncbi:MAG TPA: hypothetical protein VL356_00745 [Acidocella sp.]|nr:hypothetical protein [Acidocella sp.]